MKTITLLALLVQVLLAAAQGSQALLTMVAHDSADHPHYDLGWKEGTGREISFGEWRFFVDESDEAAKSGSYLASVKDIETLSTFSHHRAFALFAGREGGGEIVSQRNFQGKIWEGDVFSCCLQIKRAGGGPVVPGGLMGVALSPLDSLEKSEISSRSNAAEFVFSKESKNYLLRDGDGTLDTGVEAGKNPISVSFELLPNATYRVQVASLGKSIDDVLEIYDAPVRKLRGVANCEEIRSMGFFIKDGGLNDLYFDDIVLDRHVDD